MPKSVLGHDPPSTWEHSVLLGISGYCSECLALLFVQPLLSLATCCQSWDCRPLFPDQLHFYSVSLLCAPIHELPASSTCDANSWLSYPQWTGQRWTASAQNSFCSLSVTYAWKNVHKVHSMATCMWFWMPATFMYVLLCTYGIKCVMYLTTHWLSAGLITHLASLWCDYVTATILFEVKRDDSPPSWLRARQTGDLLTMFTKGPLCLALPFNSLSLFPLTLTMLHVACFHSGILFAGPARVLTSKSDSTHLLHLQQICSFSLL